MPVLTVRTMGGMFLLQHWLAGAALLPVQRLARLKSLAGRLGIGERVRFRVSDKVETPCVFGWLRPVVLLPTAVVFNLPVEELEVVVLHELIHLRRHDYLWGLVQRLAEALFFFNPALWWLSRRMDRDRELACDADVLGRGIAPLGYARLLASLATMRDALPSVTLGAVEGDLLMRIEHIVNGSGRSHQTRRSWLAPLVVVLASGFAATLVACFGGDSGAMTGAVDDGRPEPAVSESEGDEDGFMRAAPRWLPSSVTRHQRAIERAAEAHGVEPAVLSLMVLVESLGDPAALSPVGARGLMQFMPSTAREVAGRLGIALESEDALYDVELSLELGAAHFRELLERYADRSPRRQRWLAWAGYNAGTERVQAYLEEGRGLPRETQRYVALLSSLHDGRLLPDSMRYRSWQARANRAR